LRASPIADGGSVSSTAAIFNPAVGSEKAAPKGYKVQYVGHSFHVFVPTVMASLAKEAGISAHQSLGMDMLPASYPCQHWNKNPNTVKNVLNAGKADVLTLATRELAPDECVSKFAKLAFKGNKNIRVMVQETWLPVSSDPNEKCTPARVGPGERDARINKCSNRDGTTVQGNEKTRAGWELPVRNKLRAQLQGLNKEFGRNVTSLVTTWDGIISLRNAVLKGQVPGVKKQTSLFLDGLGHPTTPLKNFVGYMWFSAMYGVNPNGMKSLAGSAPAGQAKILQEIAWKTVKSEPLNGLS